MKKEIMSIDSQLDVINKKDEINKIKARLKKAAKEMVKQKQNTKTRNLEEILQEDVIDQLDL